MKKHLDPAPKTDSSAPHSTPSAEAPAQPTRVEIVDTHAAVCYANFCRVTGTPEELILDFGLNNQPMGVPTEPLELPVFLE